MNCPSGGKVSDGRDSGLQVFRKPKRMHGMNCFGHGRDKRPFRDNS